jgi:carboxypeptidase Q
MDHVFRLADVYGPRLTGSPAFQAAGEWAVKQLQEWGLQNVKLEKWGPFGKGWSLVRYSGNMIEPQPAPINGVPLPWAPGTNGRVTGEAIYAPLPQTSDQELEKGMSEFKGKLRGKIVMPDVPPAIALQTTPPSHRLTEEELSRPFEPAPRRSPLDGLVQTPPAAGSPAARAANRARVAGDHSGRRTRMGSDRSRWRWTE